MNLFNTIFFIIYNIIIGIFVCYYCVALGNKQILQLKVIFSALLFVFYYFYNSSSYYFYISTPKIPFLLSILIFMFFCFFSNYAMRIKIEFSLIPEIIFSFFNIYVDSITFFINQLDYASTYRSVLFYSTYVVQTIFIGVVFILIIKHIKNTDSENALYTDSVIIIISIIISIILYIAEHIRTSIYSSLTLVSLTLFTVLLFKIQSESRTEAIEKEKEKQEQELLKAELAINKKYLESQEELHILKHDVQHILSTIKEDNSSSISEKIDKSLETISKIAIPLDTGNKTLDSILNIKRDVAESKDITFICTANIDNDIILSDDDLTLLLINILDNAIDHIGKGKRIEVTIKKADSRLLIRVCNSIDEEIPLTGNLYKIPENTNNGYGVKTIQKIVKKYNGVLDYSQDYNILTCAISLPY